MDAAPARLHRTSDSGVHVEGGGRGLPNGLSRHQDCPGGRHREAYDAGPQNSNGTTLGQVMAAGPQSAQPEGVHPGATRLSGLLLAARGSCIFC